MDVRTIVSSAIFWGAAFLGLCFTHPAFSTDQPARQLTSEAAYVDIYDHLSTSQQRDAWLDIRYQLKRNFDDICSDTFCSGQYTNIEALRYRCSVNASTGVIGECIWTFAASEEDIDPSNGKVVVKPRVWQCASPIAPFTRADELIAALANSRPLASPLPHNGETLHYALIDCLY